MRKKKDHGVIDTHNMALEAVLPSVLYSSTKTDCEPSVAKLQGELQW